MGLKIYDSKNPCDLFFNFSLVILNQGCVLYVGYIEGPIGGRWKPIPLLPGIGLKFKIDFNNGLISLKQELLL